MFPHKKLMIFVFLVASTFVFNSCGKNLFGCTEESYSFQINATIPTANDSINLGDTIWLQVITPKKLKDQNTDEFVNYSGASNLGTALSLSLFKGGGSASE